MRALAKIAVIAGLLFGAAPVMAQESTAAMNWEGFYVGVWGGYHAGDSRNTACVGVCNANVGFNGAAAGVTGGYDYLLENDVVVGAFVTVPLFAPTGTTPDSFSAVPQFALIAGGRIGMVMGDALPYVFIGGALANVTTSAPGVTASNATHFGGVIGAGVEYAITANLSLDLRYTAGYLGSAEYDFCPGVLPSCKSSYDEISQTINVGLNYRF